MMLEMMPQVIEASPRVGEMPDGCIHFVSAESESAAHVDRCSLCSPAPLHNGSRWRYENEASLNARRWSAPHALG